MPSWNTVLNEIATTRQEGQKALDTIRRKYLLELFNHTGRNIIAYYSGWLERRVDGIDINDQDMNGFMNAVHGLDRSKGLDLILHTPGGQVAAAESIVSYLRQMFGSDIRAVVPQLAMSAGTMIACSCRAILMGKQSSLGPIDPQFGLISAKGVKEEFERAMRDVRTNPSSVPIWQVIIGKYHPTFIAQCENSCTWSESLVCEWLKTNMFKDHSNPEEEAQKTTGKLAELGLKSSHAKHLSLAEAREFGLVIEGIEDDQTLQDLVLTVHHAYMHTISNAPVFKIIENHTGAAVVQMTNIPQQR